MAGHGGAGKSTLSRAIATRLGGVVLDLDTIKSALLDAEIGWDGASKGSYAVIYELADDMLSTTAAPVIVDTPSYWSEIHERLTAIADAHDAEYRFVECTAAQSTRAERLANRFTRRSQMRAIGDNAVDAPANADAMHLRPIERPDHRVCVAVSTEDGFDLDAIVSELDLQLPE